MDLETYNSVLRIVNSIPLLACPHFSYISKQIGVPKNTLHSIYSQEVQWRLRQSIGDLKARVPELVQQYTSAPQSSSTITSPSQPSNLKSLTDTCFELNLPPCFVLRQILPTLFRLPKKAITDIFKEPNSLLEIVTTGAALSALQEQGHPDPTPADANAFLHRLLTDIQACVLADINCGPASDAARHAAGLEFEEKLNQALHEAGIAHWTERNLRDAGHHKTPDARLRVPIAVQGKIICWIDSKATFGDERQHTIYKKEQYDKYLNRYGSGMVVYWHGYLASLQSAAENVLLVDQFPEVDRSTAPATIAAAPAVVMLEQLDLDKYLSLPIATNEI